MLKLSHLFLAWLINEMWLNVITHFSLLCQSQALLNMMKCWTNIRQIWLRICKSPEYHVPSDYMKTVFCVNKSDPPSAHTEGMATLKSSNLKFKASETSNLTSTSRRKSTSLKAFVALFSKLAVTGSLKLFPLRLILYLPPLTFLHYHINVGFVLCQNNLVLRAFLFFLWKDMLFKNTIAISITSWSVNMFHSSAALTLCKIRF